MSNRVTHFEIPCDNPLETMTFFEKVFSWKFERFGDQDYWFTKTSDDDSAGINGAIIKKRHPEQPITNSIEVNSIDSTTEQIKREGGEIVVAKMPIPGMGWLAFFKDPDGNIHGLWEKDKNVK
jgi:hypothetical protein